MHFQKKMLWLTFASSIICMVAFHFLKLASNESNRPTALFFALFFYYGLFAINGPLFLSIKDKTQLFEPRFLFGTILIIIWNVLVPLLAIVIA